MFALTLRAVAVLLLACGTWAVTGTPALAVNENPLSPETIVEKSFTGKATVEFLVGEVYLKHSSWAASAHRRWKAVPLRIVPKADATKERVMVLLSGEITARLKRLGIENPSEHFRGKVLRVSGTVECFQTRAGPEYRIQVNSLDQLEAIRKP
ncbi:MAG TPA: hypothetical protein VH643_41465 [Gemmataceae bacterium]|jgi:hypothetical protein